MKIELKVKLRIYFGVREEIVTALLRGATAFQGDSGPRTTRHGYTLLSGDQWEHSVTTFGPLVFGSLRRLQ